jgi:hypothetical protein
VRNALATRPDVQIQSESFFHMEPNMRDQSGQRLEKLRIWVGDQTTVGAPYPFPDRPGAGGR